MKQHNAIATLAAALFASALIFGYGCSEQPSANSPAADAKPKTAEAAKTAPKPSREIVVEANDQMKFSKTSLTLAPGETIRLVLNNVGTMPKFSMGHNLVILDKDADLMAFAEASAMSPANEYIAPELKDQVVAATKLLGGGESDSIVFTAPAKPGEYPFLCTFPGHLQAGMKGILTVR